MSVEIMSLVWHSTFGDPVTKAIALKLADYADESGGHIWPSVATIARQTEYDHRTVQRRIKWLCANNVIRQQRKGGGRYTSLYEFTPDWRLEAENNRHAIRTDKAATATMGGVTETPGGCHRDTGGVSQRHPRGVSKSPQGCHTVTQTINEPSLNLKAELHQRFKRKYRPPLDATAHVVRPRDAQWHPNLDVLRARGEQQLAEAAERTGRMITYDSLWLTKDGPLPKIDQ